MLKKLNIYRFLKPVLCLILIFVSAPGMKLKKMDKRDNPFDNKIVRCAIALDNDMYARHGLEAGMNYELLKIFAQKNKCTVKIDVYTPKQNPIDSLEADKADIVVIEKEKLAGTHSVFATTTVSNSTVWVTGSRKFNEITWLNDWIFRYSRTKDFKRLENRFLVKYDPAARAASGKKYRNLSPYDEIIQEESLRLGWDWRLLVALLWRESRFSINSRSPRGAEGIMQVMPATGRHYDVYNLLDPYENMEAGTKHLNRVQRFFRKYNLTDEELVKFTLAAYNAGEGRILDCMRLAEHLEKDKTRWDDIVEVIPLMNDSTYQDSGIIKLGNFKGTETINYVKNIIATYKDLCTISE